jgi:hypothetical protein
MKAMIVPAPRIQRMLLALVLVVSSFVAQENARAQPPVVTASLTNNGSSTVTITSNQSFTLTLMITTNFPSSGMTYFLQSNAAGSGLFAITAIDRTGSPYLLSPPIPGPCGIACVLNPSNDFDLGGTTNGSDINPAGTYTIATITFSTMNAPVGQYTISIDRGVVTDRTGGGFDDRAFSAVATINVVPEPSAIGLAVIGGAALLILGWRRRRAQV